MERNLNLYPWYQMLADAMAWMPVFFLYFNAHLPFAEVVRLGALYYVAVVTLEVPSGYFSDKMGRRLTLLCAAVAFVGAYSIFIIANSFVMFAVAQVALATGMAFRSGTDTAFHYETLSVLAKQDEYAQREARIKRLSLITSAAAMIAGGLAGSINLAYAYWLSLIAATGSVGVALLFREPEAETIGENRASFFGHVGGCISRLKDPVLRWLFAFFVVAFILAHVPYEFYQPYLGILESRHLLRDVSAPLVSGILLGITMLFGAWLAGHSVRIRDQVGLVSLLLLAVGLQIVIIGALGVWLHVTLIGLLMLRNIPMALTHAPINAAIAPRIENAQRATYLSIQSLAARLGFGVTLYIASLGINIDTTDWPTLSFILKTYAVFGILTLSILFATSRKLVVNR